MKMKKLIMLAYGLTFEPQCNGKIIAIENHGFKSQK